MLRSSAQPAALARKEQQHDRRRHQRVRVSLLGRYMLPDRREFPCQTIDMSPGGVAFAAPVKPALGARIVAYLDSVGRVEGTVARHIEDGFALHLNVPLIKREKLADQLTWLANSATLGMPEDRRHERIEPHERYTVLRLADGREYRAKIIDISLSGVAARTDARPPLGTPVTIGETSGRVVRVFDEGVAIEFAHMLPAESFDEDIRI